MIEVAPLPDPPSFRSATVKVYTTTVKLDRPLPGLRPGMTARVEILVSEHDNVLSVPVAAIVRYDDKDHVAVKKGGDGFDWREVTLGVANDRVVEVKAGLKAGEQVIVTPLDLLTEEQKREKHIPQAPPTATRSTPR